jgi:hypothetical protein
VLVERDIWPRCFHLKFRLELGPSAPKLPLKLAHLLGQFSDGGARLRSLVLAMSSQTEPDLFVSKIPES